MFKLCPICGSLSSYDSHFQGYRCFDCGAIEKKPLSVFEQIKQMKDTELAAFLEDKFKPESMTYDDILSWIRGGNFEQTVM